MAKFGAHTVAAGVAALMVIAIPAAHAKPVTDTPIAKDKNAPGAAAQPGAVAGGLAERVAAMVSAPDLPDGTQMSFSAPERPVTLQISATKGEKLITLRNPGGNGVLAQWRVSGTGAEELNQEIAGHVLTTMGLSATLSQVDGADVAAGKAKNTK